MFYLSKIEHTLRLPPHLLSLPIQESIHKELEKLFLDKVVFTLIMFRPFVGEIITAKLLTSDADGLRLSLGFFDDIYVPMHHMPNPSHFEGEAQNSKKGTWYWDFNEQPYPIDDTDEIKFQVQSVSYPSIPVEQPKESKPFAPMVVTGSLDHDGLGPVSWWYEAEEVEDEQTPD